MIATGLVVKDMTVPWQGRLDVSEAAVDLIAERGYQPEYSARPMRRVIQRELDDRIADLFVASDPVRRAGVRFNRRELARRRGPVTNRPLAA